MLHVYIYYIFEYMNLKIIFPMLLKSKEIPTYFAALTCYISILGFAYVLGYASPTQGQLIQEKIVSEETFSIFASISTLGSCLGIAGTFFGVQYKFNSNVIVMLSCLIGGIGWLIIANANSAMVIISGMFFVGVFGGCATVFSKLYISEISLSSQRRVLGGIGGFCFRTGILVVYALGIYLPFRWLAVVGLFIIFIFALSLSINPKSPEWYVSQGLDEQAKETLFYLHGEDFDADSESQNIRNNLANKQFTWIDSFNALRKWKVVKPILLMVACTWFKVFGGHEAMVSFSSHILQNQQGMKPELASLFYPIFLTAGAIFSMIILKYFKLKWQIIVGNIFQTLSHLSMAIYYFISDNYLHCMRESSLICQTISFWPILNIGLNAFAFSMGWGLIYFSLIAILYVSYKEIAIPITSLICNASIFIVINVFYILMNTIGGFGTFLCLAMVNLTSVFFVYFSLNI